MPRFLLNLVLQPLFFEVLCGDALDHPVEPLIVKMLRSFTGLPVLNKDGVEFGLPLRLLDNIDCERGLLLRLQNLANFLAVVVVGACACSVHVVVQRTGSKSLCFIENLVVVLDGLVIPHAVLVWGGDIGY